MTADLDQRCRELVEGLSLGAAGDITAVVPLTGGVASDIARVDLDGQSICVKFALPKLKVAEDWRAPVHRNRAEYEWLRAAARIVPESAVALYGRLEAQHGFAMEFLAGNDVYLWKPALLKGQVRGDDAARVGDMVGRIHAVSAKAGFDTGPFQNRDDFRALRIEPYLTFTARQHPVAAGQLSDLARILYDSAQVLVHGDVSPKNILFRDGRPVILDAECATMGDASFDPAFCLNHLVLKAVHLPGSRTQFLRAIHGFWSAYAAHIDWEPASALEARICRLLPALMLARVDGKSPVEYLDTTERETVRAIAIPLIQSPVSGLAEFVSAIKNRLEDQTT